MNSFVSALALSALASGVAAQGLEADDFTLSVPGAEDGLESRLRSASLVRQAIEDERTEPNEILAAARAEYRRLLGTLYGQGYYSPVISVSVDGREAAEISPLHVPVRIDRVAVVVQPGPAFTFSAAEVAPVAAETELPEDFRAGERAKADSIRQAAAAGIAGWRAQGHAKADIAREDIVADHARDLLSARIGIDPGPRLRFGPLVVRGNKRVRTERIRAIAGLPSGEVYDPEELEKAAARLRRTEAFRSVSLRDADEIGPGDLLAIEADLLEEKRRRFGVGLELSSVEGLRFNTYWLHRNLLGGAERLRFDLEIENISATDEENGVDYLISASFSRPATPMTDTDLYLRAQIAREDEPGYLSDSITVAGGFTRIFSDTLEGSVGLLYRAAQVEDAFGNRDYQLLGVPVDLTWDTRDDPLDAKAGYYIKAEVQPFAGISGIDNGALTEVDARAYRGIGERIVLAGRAQFGSLVGPEIDTAPPDYLFFAGGGGSVRGQPFQALGTREINGTVVGGRSYLAFAAEARVAVRGPIGIVGFYDTGYVGEEELYDGSGNWLSGAGLGVRYDTGFGPLRVDIATPVSGGPDDAARVQLYIGIGQAF